MPTPARRAAFAILLRVEMQSSFATELLHSSLTEDLSAPDAALTTEMVLGTLRWQGQLDFIAKQLVQRKWASLDPEVLVALRLGLHQLRFLSRIPARAAVHESVELVKSAGKASAAGLVNAVLRKGATVDLESLRPQKMTDRKWLAVETSHPDWMLNRWVERFGLDNARSLACAQNQTPPTCLRVNSPSATFAEAELELRADGVELSPGRFLRDCRVVQKGNVSRTDLFRRGELVAQDEASQVVPLLLDVRSGDRVLDLCAAPGNKTAQLARQAGSSGQVVACDLHVHRLREMIAPRACAPVFARVFKVALDGSRLLPFRSRFDRILVDAPCSGTGTLRRHPEIKWRLKPDDIEDLSATQSLLLERAAAVLAPGGRIVYSTCSLEPEENARVVERFLAAHPEFRLLPLREDAVRLQPFFLPESAAILGSDFLETFPDRHGTDGFFAAILVPAS